MKLVLGILLSIGVYFLVTNIFAIREIQITGGNIKVEVDKKKLPKTLLFFPSDKIRKEMLQNNPVLADIRFEKKYPYTLIIIPTLRSTAAMLITASRQVCMDQNGTVLADCDRAEGAVPKIYAPLSVLRIGQQVSDTGVKVALLFLAGIQNTLPVETISIADDGVLTAHTEKLDILFTQDADTASIASTLQTLMTGFRIKGTLPAIIDLRFDKPVITL